LVGCLVGLLFLRRFGWIFSPKKVVRHQLSRGWLEQLAIGWNNLRGRKKTTAVVTQINFSPPLICDLPRQSTGGRSMTPTQTTCTLINKGNSLKTYHATCFNIHLETTPQKKRMAFHDPQPATTNHPPPS